MGFSSSTSNAHGRSLEMRSLEPVFGDDLKKNADNLLRRVQRRETQKR